MRVACICSDPAVPVGGTGGPAAHLRELSAAIAAEGAHVLVLAASIAPGAPTSPDGVRVEPLASLSERLRRFGADAVLERLAPDGPVGAGPAADLGVPYLVELNAPYPGAAEAVALADVVLAVSPPLATWARAQGARAVEVVPNATIADRFPAPRFRAGDRPVAVLLGTRRPWHGIDTLAEAWERLGARAPRLVVVGEGHGATRLAEVGAELRPRVTDAALPALLTSADIGLVPYGREAPSYLCPMKLFDLLAAGLAVVANELPAITAAVDHDTAVLVPRGNARALAQAVRRLADDPGRRTRMGLAGRRLVAGNHTWRHRARQVLLAAETQAIRRAA